MEFLVAPLILFMIIVAPMWVTMHYRSKNKAYRQISDEDRDTIEGMLERFDKMADRIDALESILDKEHSGWKSKN